MKARGYTSDTLVAEEMRARCFGAGEGTIFGQGSALPLSFPIPNRSQPLHGVLLVIGVWWQIWRLPSRRAAGITEIGECRSKSDG